MKNFCTNFILIVLAFAALFGSVLAVGWFLVFLVDMLGKTGLAMFMSLVFILIIAAIITLEG